MKTQRHWETPREDHITTEVETGAIQLQAKNTNDFRPPTEAEREAGRFNPRASRSNQTCQLLDFGLLNSITVRE